MPATVGAGTRQLQRAQPAIFSSSSHVNPLHAAKFFVPDECRAGAAMTHVGPEDSPIYQASALAWPAALEATCAPEEDPPVSVQPPASALYSVPFCYHVRCIPAQPWPASQSLSLGNTDLDLCLCASHAPNCPRRAGRSDVPSRRPAGAPCYVDGPLTRCLPAHRPVGNQCCAAGVPHCVGTGAAMACCSARRCSVPQESRPCCD